MSNPSNGITEELWNSDITPESYGAKYHEHIFAQYKLCIQAAETVSSRRNAANTFFLSINSLMVTVIAFLYKDGPFKFAHNWFVLFPLVAVLCLCYTWRRVISSYKQLNNAKFKVIGEYEKRLPSRPYVSAEWKALGEGKAPELYKPLSDVEKWVPWIFAGLYCFGALLILLSS